MAIETLRDLFDSENSVWIEDADKTVEWYESNKFEGFDAVDQSKNLFFSDNCILI